MCVLYLPVCCLPCASVWYRRTFCAAVLCRGRSLGSVVGCCWLLGAGAGYPDVATGRRVTWAGWAALKNSGFPLGSHRNHPMKKTKRVLENWNRRWGKNIIVEWMNVWDEDIRVLDFESWIENEIFWNSHDVFTKL